MTTPLEDMEFLARSEYRGRILQLLSEESQDRGDLSAATDASQATLGRRLEDLEERQWIRRNDQRYEATPLGRIVAEEFTDFHELLQTEHKLRDIGQWLPIDLFEFDITHLAEATITTPTPDDPTAPMQRALDHLEQATHVRSLSHAFAAPSLRVIREETTEGSLTFEGVTSRAALDGMVTAHRKAVLNSGHGAFYIHENIPSSVGMAIGDQTLVLLVRDDEAVLQAVLETNNEDAVRDWAEETYEQYRREAEVVTSDT
jgi:predicted transcriptional regulator